MYSYYIFLNVNSTAQAYSKSQRKLKFVGKVNSDNSYEACLIASSRWKHPMKKLYAYLKR